MNSRDKFNTWAVSQGLDVSYSKSFSSYKKAQTFFAWRVWKAARASIVVSDDWKGGAA
jgi:hypothetical protein